MYEEQEHGLGEVSIAVDVLHNMSNDLHDELGRQEKFVPCVATFTMPYRGIGIWSIWIQSWNQQLLEFLVLFER